MKHIIKYLMVICIMHTGNNHLLAQKEGPCATITTPEELQYLEKSRNARKNIAEINRTRTERAPVNYLPVHHVVIRKSDGTGGVSNAAIQTMMNNLNNFYAQGDIQFFACDQVQYVNSDTYYSLEMGTESGDMYNLYDRSDRFVIYYVQEIIMEGRNTWCGVRSGGGDHIVMDDECLDGVTITHELGHYFGLAHTHGSWNCPPDSDPDKITDEWVDGSNARTAGDRIEDTPADPNMGCSRNWVNSSCQYTGTVRDLSPQKRLFTPNTHNIMCYGSDCKDMLTDDQWAQVQYTLFDKRSHLLCIPCNNSLTDLNVTTNVSSGSHVYTSLDDIFVSHAVSGTASATYVARKKIVIKATTSIASNGRSHIYIDDCATPANPPVIRSNTNAPVGVQDPEKTKATDVISLSPNPVSDILTLTIKDKQGLKSISCTNIIGQLVPVTFKAGYITVNELPKGVYVLSITLQNGKTVIRKFVKQ